MLKKTNLTIDDAFQLLVRKCRVKNLTENSIKSYKEKLVHFYEFANKDTMIDAVTIDIVDNYILWLRDKGNINEIT